MFGRSYQRDGSGKKSGTDLGKWEGASIDETTGTRIWKWTGGQKCWNGPKRSATVLVTCGAETKIISADEPNICEYEFKMESYIGCDDRHRTAHEIQ
jgi:protein kinase C substrate 80K-H